MSRRILFGQRLAPGKPLAMRPSSMRTAALFFLTNLIVLAGARVTSQEQFKRFLQDRSPTSLTYNFERGYVEVPAGEKCPAKATAFFFLHISKEGVVETARGHLIALSSDLRGIALSWAHSLLRQMHFRPLLYDNR